MRLYAKRPGIRTTSMWPPNNFASNSCAVISTAQPDRKPLGINLFKSLIIQLPSAPQKPLSAHPARFSPLCLADFHPSHHRDNAAFNRWGSQMSAARHLNIHASLSCSNKSKNIVKLLRQCGQSIFFYADTRQISRLWRRFSAVIDMYGSIISAPSLFSGRAAKKHLASNLSSSCAVLVIFAAAGFHFCKQIHTIS